jgi:hypothetical protein
MDRWTDPNLADNLAAERRLQCNGFFTEIGHAHQSGHG